MNFSRTVTGVLVGIIFAAAGQPSLTVAREQHIAQALAPEQINLRAKQITVSIDGSSTGSGVILEQSDNTYTVLTNWHVVKNPGQYSVQTTDGREHPVEYATVKQLAQLDLAVLQFTSNQNYQLAEVGNSDNLIEGQNVYFAGYPGELRQENNRYYRFFTANLVGILPQATENGYALIYNGEAFPGMSGGPVFDRNGRLIGIHGEANIHALTGATSNYAIPIHKYQQAIASNPEPANNTTETPTEPAPTATNEQNESVTEPQPSSTPSEPTPTATNEQTSPETSQTPSESTPTAPNPDEPVTEPAPIATNEQTPPEVTVETGTEPQPSSTPSESAPTATNEQTTPEVTVETGAVPNPNEAVTEPQTASEAETNTAAAPSTEQASTPLAENIEQNPSAKPEGNTNPSSVVSIPTFTPSNSSVTPTPADSNPITPRPTVSPPSPTPNPTVSPSSPTPEPGISQPSSLISAQTGIDYTPLRNLLAESKWEEADRQTYDLIEQIIKTAKRRNPHTFIELKTIAEFSCPDVATIDRLWKEHSGGKYGFSPQQQIWQTVNQKGDFSTETWRSFATQVGWKHGDVASSSGYLLYEQLIFDPQTAPVGHLPWWFALPEESQNVIKHLFSRCNLNEVQQNNPNQVRQENEVRPAGSTPKQKPVGAIRESPLQKSE